MAHPMLIICPYLPLQEPIEFADWTIGPLAAFDGRWADPKFEAQARAFLAKFLDDDGKPIERPSVLVRRGGQIDGRPLALDELEALNLSLAFGFIDKNNPRITPATQKSQWATLTSDNTEVYAWPIDIDEGHVTLTTGVMHSRMSGGYTIADRQLIIRPPLELHMPLGESEADPALLDAVYRVVLGSAMSAGANQQADRVRAAVRWFTKAWWNSNRLHMGERLVFLKTGFEALTGKSDNRLAAAALRTLFQSLPNTSANDSEQLIWSPAETPQYPHTYQEKGKTKTTTLTDLEYWFIAFGRTRNKIIHDGIVPPLHHSQPGSAYEGSFVATAEFLLRAAVKANLHVLGYSGLWRSPLGRAGELAREFLLKQQAEDATGESSS